MEAGEVSMVSSSSSCEVLAYSFGGQRCKAPGTEVAACSVFGRSLVVCVPSKFQVS